MSKCSIKPINLFLESKVCLMSIDPAYWGAAFWTSLYSVAQGYPLKAYHVTMDHRTSAIHFFESLQLLLPCSKCREEYVYLCYKYPIENYVKDRASLTSWVHTIDNEIREQNGKEPRDLDGLLSKLEEYRVKDEAPQTDYIMTRKIQQQGSGGKKTFVTRRTPKGYEIMPTTRVQYFTNSASPFATQPSVGGGMTGSGGGGCGCGR